jgi:cytochrome c biogenesis protein
MRFALFLLLILAMASIAAIACGEFLPTGGLDDPEGFYAEKLSHAEFFLIKHLGLLHPYSSWWYLGLMAALSLSLTSCLASRLGPVLRESFGNEALTATNELAALPLRAQARAEGEASPAEIARRVGKLGFKVQLDEKPGEFQVAGTRRGLGRLGGIFNHVGLLSIFVGGIMMGLLSERRSVWMSEGNELASPGGGYSVVLDSFLVKTNAEGEISDYQSHVQVKRDGRTVSRQTIEVNHPLRYAGWTWYQSTYQILTDRLRWIEVVVHNKSTGVDLGHVMLRGEKPSPIPGRPDVHLVMGKFYPHFQIREGEPVSLSDRFENPAVHVQVVRPDKPASDVWLFANHPDFAHGTEPDLQVKLIALEPLFATGLQVRSFPGAWAVWVGFGLMTLGLVLSFGWNHERIWIFGHRGQNGDWILDVGAKSMHREATLKEGLGFLLRRLECHPETEVHA